jgi:hypothetical protein
MSKYFFHTDDGRCYPDQDGVRLPSVAAAKDRAVLTLCEMLREHRAQFIADRSMRIVVTDDTGLMLFEFEVFAVDAPVLGG